MKRLLAVCILILFAGIGIVGFWYWQKNVYSKEVLKLEILAPEEVVGGEEFEYLVKLKHNGKVRLENTELIFEAPQKAVLRDIDKLRITQKIEDVYPGEERSYAFRARLFALEGETLTAKAWVSYQPKNLEAVFESKTSCASKIKSVPLTFEFDLPPRVEKDEEISFSLNYFSNIDFLLENLKVKIEYPLGFSYIGSYPEAFDKTEWLVYSLYRASGGKIEVRGRIEGQEGQEKLFSAQLGLMRDGDFWPLKEARESLKIVEPSLYISTLLNNSQEYTSIPGELLHYEIFFKNIGAKPIQKKFLVAKLEGDFFDLASLKSDNGETGKGDNTVLWDWQNVTDLRFLDVGDEGKVEFWIRLKDKLIYRLKNPKLNLKVNLGGLEKVFETKLNSDIELSQKVYFEQEFFENSGPLPPVAGEKTQFVVVWQISNTWNKLANVKVRTVLPENVRLTGEIFPEDARLTYDSQSHEALWSVGEVEPFRGSDENPALSLAFQIELLPEQSDGSQASEPLLLIKEAELSAEDTWTSEILTEKANAVDITAIEDETVSEKAEAAP